MYTRVHHVVRAYTAMQIHNHVIRHVGKIKKIILYCLKY